MTEIHPTSHCPVALDRLIAGGSLYPPPDVPTRSSRRVSVLIIVGCAITAWVITALMVWPVLL